MAFALDGRTLATGSDDRILRLWDVNTRDEPRELGPLLTGHTNTMWGMAFAPDGHTLVSGDTDWTVRLWVPPIARRARVLALAYLATAELHAGNVPAARAVMPPDALCCGLRDGACVIR